MTTALAEKTASPIAAFSRFMDKMKPQMALALPKHLTADRMARLALTQFSTNPALQECTPGSIAASIMTASTLGLEIGVNGQGYLVPYKTTCTFIPGWKGLVDIANRSGRCTVWTGAVFDGDEFDFALGDNPYIKHRPGDEDDPAKLLYVYAVGRVKGSDWPVIEVWRMSKIWKHRDQYNKVGQRHYSYRDKEMYARKVPLLQVLKYMPSSIELANALTVAHAAEEGRGAVIDGDFVTVDDRPQRDDAPDQGTGELQTYPQDKFDKDIVGWASAIAAGKKTPDDIIAMAGSKHPLTEEQKARIRTAHVPAPPVVNFAQVADKLNKATTLDQLADAASLISSIADDSQRAELTRLYTKLGGELAV